MSLPQPIDSSVRAEYQDGFMLDETEHKDVAQFDKSEVKHNIFYDILNRLPEAEHGKMVKFTVFWKNRRYDVNWRNLPENARPIRFRHGYHHFFPDGTEEMGYSEVDFGYQYTNDNGENIQEVQTL
ncbi:MAG TPA: hypothetical protein VNG51_19420 [Ktedonobacteraceae bacterium]|nr:hypothetical protein [Ktedonobacteraceae bacterium]